MDNLGSGIKKYLQSNIEKDSGLEFSGKFL